MKRLALLALLFLFFAGCTYIHHDHYAPDRARSQEVRLLRHSALTQPAAGTDQPTNQPTVVWVMYAVNTNHPVYGPVAEWGIVHVEGTNEGTIVIAEKSELTNATWTDIGTLTFSSTKTNDLVIPGDELPDHLFHNARLLTP
jgi:hypothetical protein